LCAPHSTLRSPPRPTLFPYTTLFRSTALKITPVLALAYLAAAGRWRTAFMVGIAGLAVLGVSVVLNPGAWQAFVDVVGGRAGTEDRKSTRLNSSHVAISYAVFCLKKK